jgi:hypothetical protein
MSHVQFPRELLKPLAGELVHFNRADPGPQAGTWSITIPIEPFSSDDKYSTAWRAGSEGPFLVSTEVRLDFIGLPGEDLAQLADQSFSFPLNPDLGHIDGSIYLCGSHNPVDVTEINFGKAVDDTIPATFAARFVFEYQLRNVLNVDMLFATVLSFRRA